MAEPLRFESLEAMNFEGLRANTQFVTGTEGPKELAAEIVIPEVLSRWLKPSMITENATWRGDAIMRRCEDTADFDV